MEPGFFVVVFLMGAWLLVFLKLPNLFGRSKWCTSFHNRMNKDFFGHCTAALLGYITSVWGNTALKSRFS